MTLGVGRNGMKSPSHFLVKQAIDSSIPHCELCKTHEIFAIEAECYHDCFESECKQLCISVRKKPDKWSDKASTLARYVRKIAGGIQNMDVFWKDGNIFKTKRCEDYFNNSDVDEESLSFKLEKELGMCLFCDFPIFEKNEWCCTNCHVRDRRAYLKSISAEKKFGTVCNVDENDLWKMPDLYGDDCIMFESLLVLETLCNPLKWRIYDNLVATCTIKAKRCRLMVCVLLDASQQDHFRVSPLPPDYLGDARLSRALVFVVYDDHDYTWRPLFDILRCNHKTDIYMNRLEGMVLDLTKSLPSQQDTASSLKELCKREVMNASLLPGGVNTLDYTCSCAQHIVYPINIFLREAQTNYMFKSLLQNMFIPNVCVNNEAFRRDAINAFHVNML